MIALSGNDVPVLVAGVRTPFARMDTSLAEVPAHILGRDVVRELARQACSGQGNQTKAATLLGIRLCSLYTKTDLQHPSTDFTTRNQRPDYLRWASLNGSLAELITSHE